MGRRGRQEVFLAAGTDKERVLAEAATLTGPVRRRGLGVIPACFAFCGAVLSAPIAPALDLGRPLSQAQVDVWKTENGLPQDTVTSILRTREGHLWFGTYDGLVRFDGARFTVFDAKTTPLLATGSAFALMEDRHGAIWIGRSENVLKYENGAFTQVLGADELGQGTVWALAEAPDGTVWAGAGRGLVRWTAGKATLLTKENGLPPARIRTVCVDREGAVWIGTSGAGLARLQDGRVTRWTMTDGFPSDHIVTVLADPSGGVWVATAGAGLVRIVGDGRRVWTTSDGLPTDQLTALALDAAGSLWIGTWGSGVCRFQRGAFSVLAAPPLSNDKIWSILPDEEGFVWVGTWVGGLNRLRDRSFPSYGVPEGLSNDNVRSVLHGRDGSVWLATAGGGLNRLRDGRLEVIRKADGLPSDEVSALWEDRSGTLWVGTYTSGLAKLQGGRIEAFGKDDGLPGDDVRVVLEDRERTLWVATTSGVATSRDGRRFERVATPEWVSLNAVVCVLEDRTGALWFGTSGDGLIRRDASGFRILTTRDGLVSDRIAALYEDEEGSLWIGSAWSGINRLKEGRIAAIRLENGLAEGRSQVLLPDRFGGLWLTGNKGFQRLRKSELAAVADGRLDAVRPLSFGLADGLRSASFASGQQPAGSIGPDGRIWLPSYRGVVVVDPARIPPPPPPPEIRVEEVVVDGAPRVAKRALQIEPRRRLIEIRYAASTLRPPELVKFRFRLDGFDEDWIEVGTRRSAYYTGLRPGRYRFRVQSRVGDGEWGRESEGLELVLKPAFHQVWWFRAPAAFLVLSGVGLLFWTRTARLKRRHDELERLVGERTDALREANERLSELSFTDALTGIPNRRRLDEALHAEWKRAIRFGHPLSLVLADIDFFKRYNDALGHPAGDRCIVEVARVVQSNARRAGDLAARFGGEEFALLLPATSGADAATVAERTRAALEALALPHPDGACPVVTASFGVATFVPESDGDPERLLATADAALYRAKREGRNRVVGATPRGGRPPETGRSGEHPFPKPLP